MSIISAIHYRAKVRAPYALAIATAQLPVRSARELYTKVPSSGGKIPNVVYQTWRNDKFGRSHVKALRRFREINDDFSFEFFDEEAMNRFMRESYGRSDIEKIFQASEFGPLRTDIWRYCILYERGGVYCDIGKSFTTPLREIIPSGASGVIGFQRNRYEVPASPDVSRIVRYPDRLVINWGLMFEPRHPLLKRVIDGIVNKYPYYASRVCPDPKLAILNFTGPIHLTECLHAEAADGSIGTLYQAGIDFDDRADIDLSGSYVRYIRQRSYVTQRNCAIVS